MATAVDFGATRKQAESEGLIGGGGFFKFKEGDNRMRLMSECLPHTSVFSDGKKSFKWLCYVLDRVDGEVKPFFMPHKIYKAIEALQLNPDYTFSTVPMPYDITVNAKKAGTMDVEYALIPARKETPLTEDEQEKLDHAKPLSELKQAIDDKAKKGGNSASTAPAVSDAPQHERVKTELMDSDVPF